MDKKRIASLRARINKAQSTFNVMGDMLLQYEINAMTMQEKETLRRGLLNSRKPLSYAYLDKEVV